MAKTKITETLEYLIYDYFYLKRGLDCALEVSIPNLGRADFVGTKGDEITVVEIKTTKADFRSKSGHNLIGHRNYYAMPKDLYKVVIDEIPKHVGVIVPNGRGTVEIIKKAQKVKHIYPKRFWEVIMRNISKAKQSNVRRLLYQRAREND